MKGVKQHSTSRHVLTMRSADKRPAHKGELDLIHYFRWTHEYAKEIANVARERYVLLTFG